MESDTSPHPMVSKKHNKLIWAIPVTLAVIVIFAGLLIVARKCRHLQNSYENSGYRQLMNDDAERMITVIIEVKRFMQVSLYILISFPLNSCSSMILHLQKVVS